MSDGKIERVKSFLGFTVGKALKEYAETWLCCRKTMALDLWKHPVEKSTPWTMYWESAHKTNTKGWLCIFSRQGLGKVPQFSAEKSTSCCGSGNNWVIWIIIFCIATVKILAKRKEGREDCKRLTSDDNIIPAFRYWHHQKEYCEQPQNRM